MISLNKMRNLERLGLNANLLDKANYACYINQIKIDTLNAINAKENKKYSLLNHYFVAVAIVLSCGLYLIKEKKELEKLKASVALSNYSEKAIASIIFTKPSEVSEKEEDSEEVSDKDYSADVSDKEDDTEEFSSDSESNEWTSGTVLHEVSEESSESETEPELRTPNLEFFDSDSDLEEESWDPNDLSTDNLKELKIKFRKEPEDYSGYDADLEN